MTTTVENLRLAAINRHRIRLFGDAALEVYVTTPATGDALAGEFEIDWRARRVESTTNDVAMDVGVWQFEVNAEEDWEASQSFMLRAAALKVGSRRWTVKKVEKPVGVSLVWKIKAVIQ